MYKHIYDAIVGAGVTTREDEAVWMDRSGVIVGEHTAIGCKVTHNFVCPDIFIVENKVSGDISITGDSLGLTTTIIPRRNNPSPKSIISR